MPAHELLQRILTEPTTSDLWSLHPHLLSLRSPEAEEAISLLRGFHGYLCEVQSKLSSREHSALGARLAASSIGVIAAKDIIESLQTDRTRALANLFAGGLSSVLEVSSALQQVQAWETEFAASHNHAMWTIYTGLWELSVEMKPELLPEERHALIDRLLANSQQEKLAPPVRVALLIRLFQVLLAARLVPLLQALVGRPSGAGGPA